MRDLSSSQARFRCAVFFAAVFGAAVSITAQTNLVVARYQVLAAVGRLNAKDLALNVQLYDPTQHYNQVRNKIWGTGPSVQ